MDGDEEYEIGTISDISSIKSELFGMGEEPEGVEYTVVSGVCFMTYYGQLIGCGLQGGNGLQNSNEDILKTNEIVNSNFGDLFCSVVNDMFLDINNEKIFMGVGQKVLAAIAHAILMDEPQNVINIDVKKGMDLQS